jgi:hypothetical protein
MNKIITDCESALQRAVTFSSENVDLVEKFKQLFGWIPSKETTRWASTEMLTLIEESKEDVSRYNAELHKIRLERALLVRNVSVVADKIRKSPTTDSTPTCIICFGDYNDNHQQSCITVCGHVFGKRCIEHNFTITNRCPKCNKTYKKKDIITLFN